MNTEKMEVMAPPAVGALAPAPTVASMLQAVIQGGVSNENVAALEKLVGLYERMQDRDAEKAFAGAFVALQAEMPNIRAVKPVPGNDGTTRYTYAPYEDIMEQVSPLLKKHGFTVMFSTDFKEGRLIKTCTLQHIGGHSKSNSFAVRIGSGPPKATECQADGAASTYAKRFALCDALNIVCDKDTDARAEGAPISSDQAKVIISRVAGLKLTPTKELKLLEWVGVKVDGQPFIEDYQRIMSSKMPALDKWLTEQESKQPK